MINANRPAWGSNQMSHEQMQHVLAHVQNRDKDSAYWVIYSFLHCGWTDIQRVLPEYLRAMADRIDAKYVTPHDGAALEATQDRYNEVMIRTADEICELFESDLGRKTA